MIRNLASVLATIVWTSLLFFPTTLSGLIMWNSDWSIWWCREVWSRGLLWVGGARLEVIDQHNCDPKRPTIYMANHQSTLDIVAHFMAVNVPFRYVAKKSLKYVPFLGWYLALTRHIFIDRGNRSSAVRSLEEAGQRIRAGTSILVYPEGTRSEDGRILPFKKGPFALALKARVPIVPVTIEGSGKVQPKNSWNITPGPVRVKIGRPIDVTPYLPDDRVGLAKAVRQVMIQDSLALGGPGGDVNEVFAAAGIEGRSGAGRTLKAPEQV
jgi:1-acyl-sn-glycerol-3-phosphate acyltransferase